MRIIERLFIDTAAALVYWPLWWYSKGFIAIMTWFMHTVSYYAQVSAVGVWVRNIFTPMFGQYDWQSRIISFIVRIGNIIVRSIGLLLWTLLCGSLVIMYLLWPPLLIYGLLVYGIGI